MIYLHYYETESGFIEERNNNYEEPWASYTEETGKINYNMTEDEKMLITPLTIKSLGSGNVSMKLKNKTIQYSKNGGAWQTMTSGTSISVVNGDEVHLKGSNTIYCGNTITCTTEFNVEGNAMSLIFDDGFTTGRTTQDSFAFAYLFSGCTTLISSENLKLPAPSPGSYAYYSMFEGCTNMVYSPKIIPMDNISLSSYVCYHMFYGCTSLTTTPELPATRVGEYCYYSMFEGCTGITVAPELPATSMAYSCYSCMFKGCTSLTAAPELPATTLADICYNKMFEGCTSLTTAPVLPATTMFDRCYRCMFSGCTSLERAPELPATALVTRCYESMFAGCTNLNYIKAMFLTTPGSNYTSYWVQNVSSTGTFVKNSNATWTLTGTSGIPSNWTVQTVTP